MNKIAQLFAKGGAAYQRVMKVKNPILRLFLEGIRGIFQLKESKPYNLYIYLGNAFLALYISQYIIKLSKNELDQRQQPNLLIPKYIYKVRKQHFIYWQQARLARKKPTTFSYYEWDSNQKTMYMVDRTGKQTPLLTHNRIEDPAVMASPILEKHYPAPPQLHSKITMYIKNVDNPFDLDNHLHHKSVNGGDWLRAFYYFIYRELGLTNRYRYDEYVSKPDIYYDWEKAKLKFRVTKNRNQLYKYIESLEGTWRQLRTFLVWFL